MTWFLSQQAATEVSSINSCSLRAAKLAKLVLKIADMLLFCTSEGREAAAEGCVQGT